MNNIRYLLLMSLYPKPHEYNLRIYFRISRNNQITTRLITKAVLEELSDAVRNI
jgi:hypothetical protein